MPDGPDNYFRAKAVQQKSPMLRDNYNHKADQMDDAFRDTSSSPLKFSGAQEDNMPPAPASPGPAHATETMKQAGDESSPSFHSMAETMLYRPTHPNADKHKSNIR